MTSVFNSVEFIYFMAGIMTQCELAFLDRLKKIKDYRVATDQVVGEGSAPTPFLD